MWLQFYPKTLFDTINRSGTGVISKTELKLFYTAFLGNCRIVCRLPPNTNPRCWPSWLPGSGDHHRLRIWCHDQQRRHQADLPHLQTVLPQLSARQATQRTWPIHVWTCQCWIWHNLLCWISVFRGEKKLCVCVGTKVLLYNNCVVWLMSAFSKYYLSQNIKWPFLFILKSGSRYQNCLDHEL